MIIYLTSLKLIPISISEKMKAQESVTKAGADIPVSEITRVTGIIGKRRKVQNQNGQYNMDDTNNNKEILYA